jgi:hypothetical protein
MLNETQRVRIRKLDGAGVRAYLKRLKVCTACRRRKAAPGRPECRRCIRYYRSWERSHRAIASSRSRS